MTYTTFLPPRELAMTTSKASLLALLLLFGSACGPDGSLDVDAEEEEESSGLGDQIVDELSTSLKAPVISKNGATISWQAVPTADGYNVYFNDAYKTTISSTSYAATSSGAYKVTSFDRDTNPITYSISSNTVNVVVGSNPTTPSPGPTTPSAGSPAAPSISASGSRVSWPAVAGATGYNIYLNGGYISTVSGLEFIAKDSGNYTVTAFNKNANPTTYSTSSNTVKVTASTTPSTPSNPTSPQPSSGYREIFFDGFDGSTLSSNFSNPWAFVPKRDVSFSAQPCTQRDGKLRLAIEQIGGKRVACYLSSNRKDFGPGDNATIKIEYRANVSQVKARGAWFAGWMYVTSGNGARDNNPATGIETDVFEYMPTYQSAYNVATHDGASKQEWITPKSTFGVDITPSGYHTYGVEWNKHCQVFTFDGKKVSTNRTVLSAAKVHSIMLTMEAQNDVQWDYWQVGNFADNLRRDGAVGKVDWVRVSEKAGADTSLCN